MRDLFSRDFRRYISVKGSDVAPRIFSRMGNAIR